MTKYKLHTLAEIFPAINGDDRAKLLESIKQNGQLEDIVLHEGAILDGANRYDILTELGVTPRYVEWSKLLEEKRGKSPLEFVMAKNFDRRHLNAGQKAAIAADAKPLFAELLKQRAGTNGAPKGAPDSKKPDEYSQDTGIDPAYESQAPGRKGGAKKKSSDNKAAAMAAKSTGASTRMVERATALKKKDPKAFADVKAGKTKLTKAATDANKAAAAKKELADALKRITSISGKDTAEVMAKRKRAEVIELAAMSDTDIQKVRGLITSSGWALAKAKKYKMVALGPKNTIAELATRAIQQGVGKSGTFTHTIKVDGVALEITVKKAKEE